jgi:hypothetical protein
MQQALRFGLKRSAIFPLSSFALPSSTFVLQDSFWAAEDIKVTFDQDPQQVCIREG